MKDPKYLCPITSYAKFFERLKPGDFIEYSISFTTEEAMKICREHGFRTRSSTQSERDRFCNSFLIKVLGFIEKEEPKIPKTRVQFFNPDKLFL